MKNFEEFERRKNALLGAYDAVLASSILPVEATGPLQVLERKNLLIANRFILAVCGRINAGKSTLINALLFQSPLLPVDVTPHTAKNTQIEYGEKEAVHVTFYNKEEWNSLTEALTSNDSETARSFFAEVDAAGQDGVFKDEWVRSPALVKHFDGIAHLQQFVTPVQKGGRYTPFVKEVKVIHPHEWLRSVTVADTPGVDDPYKFREDQTKKFVTQAGAILYVTFAGQAMAQPDFDFLNSYLIHIRSEKRVIAVNKVDTLRDGHAEVESYLRGLQDHTEPSIRNVFGDSGSVMFVSALGGLIAQMLARGEQLSDDLEFQRERMENGGYLQSAKHGVDALRQKVEERLVTLKGKDILDDAASFLRKRIFERKRCILETDLSIQRGRLDDLGRTEEDLNEQIANIDKQMRLIKDLFDQQKKLVEREVGGFCTMLDDRLQEVGRKIMKQTKSALDGETEIDLIPERAAWHFTDIFDNETKTLTGDMVKCVETIEMAINNFSTKMRACWSQWESSSSLDTVLEFSTYRTLSNMKETSRKIAEIEGFETVRYQNTVFYERWLNTEKGRAKTKSSILGVLNVQLRDCLVHTGAGVAQTMEAQLREHMNLMQRELDQVQELRREHKTRLAGGHANREQESADVHAAIAFLENELATVNHLEQNVESAIQTDA